MTLKTAIATILLLLALAAPGGAEAKVFNPEVATLGNGMQIVVVTNKRAPIVTQMVWYKVGSADEERGKSGIAHFLEHLMFKSTTHMKSGEFSATVARNGGTDNAFTSYDYTSFYQTIAKEHLELVMKMEADRMQNLIVKQSEVDSERQVVLEERNMRTENSPEARLGEQINAAFFRNYPYGTPIIGWRHEIEGLTVKEIVAFHKRWYHPNNAILVVAGDVTMAEVKPLAEKYYGVIPAAKLPSRVRPSEPPHEASIRVTLADPRVRQPSWRRSYLAPSLSVGDRNQTWPLEVAAEILGGGATSRLQKELVVEENSAVSAGASYDPGSFGPTTFNLYAAPAQGVSIEQIEEKAMAIVHKLVDEGASEEEVNRAKTRMQEAATYERDSLSTGARELGAALAAGQTIDDVENWPDRIGAVTVSQVNDALKSIIKDDTAITGVLVEKEAK